MKKRFALLPVMAFAMSTAFVACDDGATEPKEIILPKMMPALPRL